MLAEYLESHGLEVEHAAHPMRGLSLLKTARFDAVVVDVMLPEIEGFEKASPIRAKSDIPILTLKARGAELQPFGRSTKVGPSYGHGAA